MVTRKDLVTAHSLDKCDSDDHSTHSPSLEGGQKLTTNSTANGNTGKELRDQNYSDHCNMDDFIYTGVTLDNTYSENDLSLLGTELPSRSMSTSSGHVNGDHNSGMASSSGYNNINLGLLLKKKKKRKKAEFLEHTIDLENEMVL